MSNRVGVCYEIRSYITPSGKSKTDCIFTQAVALCLILSLFQREHLYYNKFPRKRKHNIDTERNLYNRESLKRFYN